MKNVTKAQLEKVATELNALMDLHPQIPVGHLTKARLIEDIREAGKELMPADKLSANTSNILTILGVDLASTPKPEAKKPPPKPPKTKKKKMSGCRMVMELVCERPDITKAEIKAALAKHKLKIKDTTIDLAKVDALRVIRHLVEIGKLEY